MKRLEFSFMLAVCILLFGLMYMAINSQNVRESEYKHCMIVSTDKSICESLKEP